ncbi:MAG: hypothetical protein WBV22_05835, partial [Anaerolineaceae bacterium]
HGNEDININVQYGGIGYVESYDALGHVTISPSGLDPVQSTEKLPYTKINTPDCYTGMEDFGTITVDGTRTINPGRYNGIALGGSDHLIMNPGLYCFFGSFTTQGGQTVEVNPASPALEGVTIYMASGDVSFAGNSLIILRAPSIYMDPAIKGMLIYLPDTNFGTVTLSGTSGSSFQGTVYAPYGKIVVTGTSYLTLTTELVAGKVSISGNAQIDISDDAFVNFTRAPMIELFK